MKKAETTTVLNIHEHLGILAQFEDALREVAPDTSSVLNTALLIQGNFQPFEEMENWEVENTDSPQHSTWSVLSTNPSSPNSPFVFKEL